MLKACAGRLALASRRSLAGTPSGSTRPTVSAYGAWRKVADGTALSSGYHVCKSAAGYNAHMQAVFVSIDRNEDGAICRDELRAALVVSGMPQTPDHEATLDAMFRVADRDEDQMVGYDEFVRVLEITRQR